MQMGISMEIAGACVVTVLENVPMDNWMCSGDKVFCQSMFQLKLG